MKKLFLILNIFLLAGLSACKKDASEPILGETPEERMNKSLTEYRESLVKNTDGWKAVIYPEAGGGYAFYFKFQDDDRVEMLSDFDLSFADAPYESGFRTKAVMAPSLLFDTYSYLHLLADPNPNVAGGSTGAGYGSDFEFEFREVKGDTIHLVGKRWRTEFLLIKANANEAQQYTNGAYRTAIAGMSSYIAANANLYIQPEANGPRVQVSFNTNYKEVSLVWLEGEEVKSVMVPFGYLLDGTILQKPLVYNNIQIAKFQWDAAKSSFVAVSTTGVSYPLMTSPAPILPLYALLGINYTGITVAQAPGAVGNSASFLTLHNTLRTQLNTGTYFLIRALNFNFNVASKRMILQSSMPQTATGSAYPMSFVFNYEKDAAGNFTFTYVGNADFGSYTEARFMPLIRKLTTGQYKVDYLINGAALWGQFISQSDPDFYFAGTLR